jgi:hypothetical protein
MKTADAEKYNYKCPLCHDDLTDDPSCKGFVRHKTNANCPQGRGERDEPPPAQPHAQPTVNDV